ncbi:Mesoderm induction early response protein 1 putative isoform 1 [Tripterygium wilfordii]|uniref:Mesoderm induction early response protein 1 putative isoform 1 n=1 Tax=Tripterygium wilfordii TaxID=458696 RepID=A0A7J7DDF0_TRIWF|nr:ATG8-interacting protein 2-like [Tripterygium wilfordii]XP_038709210.1 ATG8-interacting protein 2-like [Tripterygium wilfordii]KAF5744377.1 Mesoderm induction early response protein 1 putative isoform 1 [Tripterygium wilfordii]
MADNEDSEGNISRGNEWEVVSLTASAYAAAPVPGEAEVKDDDQRAVYQESDAEASRALFMSGHFLFPPSQHENLPVEPEIQDEQLKEDMASKLGEEAGGVSSTKEDESWNLKGLNMPDEYPGIQFFDEKGKGLSVHGTEFEEGPALPSLINKEQSLYTSATLSSLHSEAALGESPAYGETLDVPEVTDPSEQGPDFPMDISQSPKPAKEDNYDGSEFPCDAWWKRRAASLFAHAKEANTFWSVFIAAAVMGLVIIGQQWRQERWQALQVKWQLAITDERMGRMMGPISRLKDVIVGDHRHRSFIRGRSSNDN